MEGNEDGVAEASSTAAVAGTTGTEGGVGPLFDFKSLKACLPNAVASGANRLVVGRPREGIAGASIFIGYDPSKFWRDAGSGALLPVDLAARAG